eukprot:scaffold34363_cov36-Phaeocystis_antarctica.AAC.1
MRQETPCNTLGETREGIPQPHNATNQRRDKTLALGSVPNPGRVVHEEPSFIQVHAAEAGLDHPEGLGQPRMSHGADPGISANCISPATLCSKQLAPAIRHAVLCVCAMVHLRSAVRGARPAGAAPHSTQSAVVR